MSQVIIQQHAIRHARKSSQFAFGAHVALILSFVASGIWLSLARDTPAIAIIGLDIGLCSLLFWLFRSRFAVLFYIHPVLLTIAAQLFESPFLSGGDGDAYVAVVTQYLDAQTLTFTGADLFSGYGILEFMKYTSIGMAPVLVLPEYIFGSLQDNTYYMWQGVLHVFLVSIVVVLARGWNTFDKKTTLGIALFAAVSPSFFDLGVAPTRHFVTFFGVFLLYVCHLSLAQRLAIDRFVWYAIAIAVVLISKWVLILPYLIFALLDFGVLTRKKITARNLALLALLIIGGAVIAPALVEEATRYVEGISTTGAAKFSYMAQIPVLGWIVKYIYALLAPFPWSKGGYFVETIYSGNWLLFLMHILSALSGLYIFMAIVINAGRLYRADLDLKRKVLYPVLMSTSILAGATGFHSYLLIYFPMMVPLVLRREYRINIFLPIAFALMLELALSMAI